MLQHSWCMISTMQYLNISEMALLCSVHSSSQFLVRQTKLAAVVVTTYKELKFLQHFQTLPSLLVLSFQDFKGDLSEWQTTVLVALRTKEFPRIQLDRAWFSRSFAAREGRGNLDLKRFTKTLLGRDSQVPKLSFTNSAVDAFGDANGIVMTSDLGWLKNHTSEDFKLAYLDTSPISPCYQPHIKDCFSQRYNPCPPPRSTNIKKRQRDETCTDEWDSENDEFVPSDAFLARYADTPSYSPTD